MPTSRPRHVVTESDELRRALDAAATRWPTMSRSRLLVRLALAGAASLDDAAARRRADRLAALERHRGALTGAYPPPGYLDEMRRDWPA